MATDPGVARSLCTLTGTFRLGDRVANYYYFLKVITGTMPPIRVSGQGCKYVYVNYFSAEAEALPPRKKHCMLLLCV